MAQGEERTWRKEWWLKLQAHLILMNHPGEARIEANHATIRNPIALNSDWTVLPSVLDDILVQYDSWSQTGGYFDGDGSTYVKVHDWVLAFWIQWVDNWKPHLEQLHSFLLSQGIDSRFYQRDGAWMLSIGKTDDVLKAAKRMLPYCSKKRRELAVIVEYLEGRISASQAIRVFNAEVESGKRMRVVRRVDLPYTRSQGLEQAKLHKRLLQSAFTEEQKREIRQIRSDEGLSTRELARRYGVTERTIRSVLHAGS